MTDFCNKILPQAEYLKNELLKKYEKEHEEYTAQSEKLRQQAEEQRQREIEEQTRREKERGDKASTLGGGSSSVGVLADADKGYPKEPFSTGLVTPGPSRIPSAPPPENDLSAPTSLPSWPSQFQDPPAWQYDPTPVQKVVEPEGPNFHGGTPSIDRSTKPSRILTPMSSGLRPLTIPTDLSAMFLRCAESNTGRNVETCGLLTGKIVMWIIIF